MNVHDFFNYNSNCPLCGKELTFFLQWFDEKIPWMNEKLFIQQGDRFQEYLLNKQIEDNKDFFFQIKLDKIQFNCQSTKKILSSGTSYFYALCNPNAVELNGEQFKVDLFKACYYRAAPYITLPKIDFSMVNLNESFSMSNREEELLKVYIFIQNYEENTSSLFYYTANKLQEEDELYVPEVFEKVLPLAKLDINDKNKLIEKLNTWINFS